MNPFSEVGVYLVQSLGSIYLFILTLRFLLQASGADFNNPVSVFLIRATHLPTKPVRKLVPTFKTIDMATVIVAIIVQGLVIQLSALLLGYKLVNMFYMLAWSVMGIVSLVLNIYLYGLLAVIILSWIAPYNRHPIVLILHQLIDPMMRPFQRLIPAIGGLDLSPIFIFLVINMLSIFLNAAAQNMLLPFKIVPGI